eukprot:scaffold4213_cov78-Skeletonema_dohrnii-CCMP3373.AAC.2
MGWSSLLEGRGREKREGMSARTLVLSNKKEPPTAESCPDFCSLEVLSSKSDMPTSLESCPP